MLLLDVNKSTIFSLPWPWFRKHLELEQGLPETPSEDSNSLCKRCKGLQMLSHIEQPWSKFEKTSYPREMIAIIVDDSMRKQCSLCYLWSDIMLRASTIYGDNKQGSKRRLELWSYRVRWGPWNGTYFSINDQQLNWKLFLLPTQTPSIPARVMSSQQQLRSASQRSLYEPFSPGLPDFKILKRWVGSCRSEHTICRGRSNLGRRAPRRLIDCRQRQLCTGKNQSYVCLSYTWGSKHESTGAAGDVLPANLPQVVSDAMAVVVSLGMRYLWVDRYCINQDDAKEKHDSIQNMGTICKWTHKLYRANLLTMHHIDQWADLTIIAAAGSGPAYGLPGISRTRISRKTLTIGDHAFVALESPGQEIGASKWNTRGWTFQEYLLSRRRLVFTDSQVYFQCLSSHNVEGIEQDDIIPDALLYNDLRAFPRFGLGFDTDELYDCLEDYYTRELSFPTDILNAFAGIFDDFSGTPNYQTNHFHGILYITALSPPRHEFTNSRIADASFAIGLAWTINGFDSQKVDRSQADVLEIQFPDWSWASHKARHFTTNVGHLKFRCRGGSLSGRFDDFIRICIHSQSGLVVELQQRSEVPESQLLSIIDITSMVMPGSIRWHRSRGTYVFSGFPHMSVQLHWDYREISQSITAIYVGTVSPEAIMDNEAIFIMVDHLGADQYRLIGACSWPVPLLDSDAWGENWLNNPSTGLSVTRLWRRKTLTLI